MILDTLLYFFPVIAVAVPTWLWQAERSRSLDLRDEANTAIAARDEARRDACWTRDLLDGVVAERDTWADLATGLARDLYRAQAAAGIVDRVDDEIPVDDGPDPDATLTGPLPTVWPDPPVPALTAGGR